MPSRRADRGQTETVGLVVLIAVTVMGITAVVGLGATALEEARRTAQVRNAEHAMTQFDSQVSLVALGGAGSQRVTISLDGRGTTLEADPGTGWMNVSIKNASTGELETKVMNVTMGRMVYENAGMEVAYQGGGVWKRTAGGATMVSPPEFRYRTGSGDPTLTLPLVVIETEGSFGGRLAVEKDGTAIPKYPVTGNAARSNPLQGGEVNVTVGSRYYRAWGRYFEARTGGDVTYDHANEEVTLTLVVPEDPRRLTRAIAATSSGEQLKLTGGGGDPAFVDSYNSTEGGYPGAKSWNGTVSVVGDVELGGNSIIHGNVRSGGVVSMEGTSEVNGTVYWTENFNPKGSATYDAEEAIDGVEGGESSTDIVTSKIDELSSNNDNAGASAITADDDLASGDGTLSAGSYYLDSDTTLTDTLTLDTSGGDVVLAVDGNLKLDGGNLTVKGDGIAEVYVGGNMDFVSDSVTHVPGDDAERLWLYGTGDADVTVKGGSNVTGVIYAPSGPGEDGAATISDGHVFGSVVTGAVEIGSGGAVHYDQALSDEEAFANTAGNGRPTPEITFLHVSVNRVNVTAG